MVNSMSVGITVVQLPLEGESIITTHYDSGLGGEHSYQTIPLRSPNNIQTQKLPEKVFHFVKSKHAQMDERWHDHNVTSVPDKPVNKNTYDSFSLTVYLLYRLE